MVVYFNATLTLAQDYSFGGWDQLGPSSVAYALGATEKGVFGLQAQNRAGDIVRAYGSAIYTDGRRLGAGRGAPRRDGRRAEHRGLRRRRRGPSSSSTSWPRMVELPPPGVPPQQDEIIAEELTRASENIERRVQAARAHVHARQRPRGRRIRPVRRQR